MVEEVSAKVPMEVRFGGEKDLLRHLRQHVKGASVPQYHIMPKGTWIGARQEAVGMRAAVYNSGPGEMEWTIVDRDHLDRLEEVMNEQHQIEIYRMEGLW
jgi:hypothetical protein